MIRVQSNVVLKYVEALDRFVKLRTFDPSVIGSLLDVQKPLRKEDYYQLVLSACLVDYSEDTRSGEENGDPAECVEAPRSPGSDS